MPVERPFQIAGSSRLLAVLTGSVLGTQGKERRLFGRFSAAEQKFFSLPVTNPLDTFLFVYVLPAFHADDHPPVD